MTREELIESLTTLKEQAQHYGNNTFVWSINIDNFKFVIDSTIKALEQESTTKNDLEVDCVLREQALKCFTICNTKADVWRGIKDLPSVTPQEPIAWIVGKNNAQIAVKNMPIDKLHKICAIIGDEQESVLDKLRAEILEEKECAYADFERYKVEYLGQDWEDALDSLPQDDFRYGMERAIELIDKYKAGQEK